MYPHSHHKDDQPILDVRKVSARYNGSLALDGITFHLHAGERIAVVGPNGAGKSTLFKVVAGIMQPSGGEIKIFGSRPRKHICIAYIPQRSQVDWNFPVSVADVVMMGRSAQLGPLGWPKKQDWDLVHEMLGIVELDDLSKRQIGELSGGQQQRMFIARALAQEAELMLMDEPLTGLDTPSQEKILVLLDALKKQNVTVMVATHDLEQAAGHFDRVMLLKIRMLGFGPPADVLQTEKLIQAYGGRLRAVGEDQVLAVDDCCGDEDEHGHVH